MEGGVAFFLLLVIVVAAIVFGIALYVTGGAIVARGDKGERRPRGKIEPIEENTTRAGPRRDTPDES